MSEASLCLLGHDHPSVLYCFTSDTMATDTDCIFKDETGIKCFGAKVMATLRRVNLTTLFTGENNVHYQVVFLHWHFKEMQKPSVHFMYVKSSLRCS